MLHVDDLFDLLLIQMESPDRWDGSVYNVGGGHDLSVSLRELTGLCVEETGHQVSIESDPKTSGVDLRIYVTDARKVERDFGWRPVRTPDRIVRDIRTWIEEHRDTLSEILT